MALRFPDRTKADLDPVTRVLKSAQLPPGLDGFLTVDGEVIPADQVDFETVGDGIAEDFGAIPLDQLGAPNGVATLDAEGNVEQPVPGTTTGLRVLLWTGTAYPARPAGVPGGLVLYKGPAQPTDWLELDEWVDTDA